MIKFIPYEISAGHNNMQKDSDLLDFAVQNGINYPIFRLYGWKPACVSLGRNQSESFIDKKMLCDLGIDVVRRLTGGRALLHADEITYSCVFPVFLLKNGENVVKSYMEISQIFVDFFNNIGINLDFGSSKPVNTKHDFCMLISTGADLCYEGKKLIGSAQFRKNGYILQHGSILYDYDKELLKKVFQENVDENLITCLKSVIPELSKEEFIEKLSTYIKNCKL